MLLIDAAKRAGIEIPAFCYWEGLSLQAACRMCLVEVEKMPKLMASCTLPVAEGMIVRTEHRSSAGAKVHARISPHQSPPRLPCLRQGRASASCRTWSSATAQAESRYEEAKLHVTEKQWSPVVFYDAPRCILCFPLRAICNEGMGVGALGIVNRGALSEIAPNHEGPSRV
jgi:NADH-quinone oxidoreductase subunit G